MSMTTRELLERLRRHYIKPGETLPGGTFLPEVGWNDGSGRGTCDAIYVGFTSTSGRILVGHELKVSRADWLAELQKPGKADAWGDQCHEWWLVVSDPAIVHDGELPAGWGLMAPGRSKTRLQVHQPAERKGPGHQPSWLACRSIMARQDTLRAREIEAGIRANRDRLSRDIEKHVEQRLAARHGPDAEELRRRLAAVEEALGAPIDWSDAKNPYRRISIGSLAEIGAAARALGGVLRAVEILTDRYVDPLNTARRELERLEQALAGLRAVQPGLKGQLEIAGA